MAVAVVMVMAMVMAMAVAVDNHIRQLLEVGTLTGSRAFNCSHSESDWDIVILEADCELLMNGAIINDTRFNNWDYAVLDDGKAYYDLSEHPEFEDEPHLEYDQHTIWGPLIRIVKYYSPDSDAIINLFVYEHKHAIVLSKFQEVTHLMNFMYGLSLANRPTRIEAFIKVLESVGITNLK